MDTLIIADVPDCTSKCHSQQHASELLDAMSTRSLAINLKAYARWKCRNYATVLDKYGRSLLHFAASTGHVDFLEWLLKEYKGEIDVDATDNESGWTGLHRAVYYKQIACAQVLLKHGASLKVRDRSGFTPLDLLLADRLPYIEYTKSDPCDVYVWGENDNYTLGLGNESARRQAEIIPTFAKDGICVKQTVINKFHTVFLTYDGIVYTCGFGHGGRLGQDGEEMSMKPQQISGLYSSAVVEEVAAGGDHTILLVEGGFVYTFGNNVYHQLGHSPPPESLQTVKAIQMKPFKLTSTVFGVGADKYHSFFFTKESLYTFGLNAGQLGHAKGPRLQTVPKLVSSLIIENAKLTHVKTAIGAIVAANSLGDVHVLHEYKCRKIVSSLTNIRTISVYGGHLDEKCQVSDIVSEGGSELMVLILTETGFVYIWKEADPAMIRCLVNYTHEVFVKDICLNKTGLCVVTASGEAFMGTLHFRRQRQSDQKPNSKSDSPSKPDSNAWCHARGHAPVAFGVRLPAKEESHAIKLKRVEFVHRAVAIMSDIKNKNFAVLQGAPNLGITEIPVEPVSRLNDDMKVLLETSELEDNVHDVIIKVQGSSRTYASHKFVLASRSDYFHRLFQESKAKKTFEIEQKIASPEAFDQVIKFCYINSNDFFENGKRLNWPRLCQETSTITAKGAKPKKPAVNPVEEVRDAAKRLGVRDLAKHMSRGAVTIIEGNQVKVNNAKKPLEAFLFDRSRFRWLSDITLESEDGELFECHRCVLVSRLEYFRSMLAYDWRESSSSMPLKLCVHSKALRILVDFIYTGCVQFDTVDIDFILQVLVVADQYLAVEMKSFCEIALVEFVNLKNACELLELSYFYNALQLKQSCLNFISINMAVIVETGSLSVLNSQALKELSIYYKNLLPSLGIPVFRQDIAHSPNAPSNSEFELIEHIVRENKDFYEKKEKSLTWKPDKTPQNKKNQQANHKVRNSRSRTESTTSEILEESHPKNLPVEELRTRESPEKNTVIVNAVCAKPSPSVVTKSIFGKPLVESPPSIRWGQKAQVTSPSTIVSIKDIMHEETSHLSQKSFPQPQLSVATSSSSASTSRSSNKKSAAWQPLEAFSSKPKSVPVRIPSNPWKIVQPTVGASSPGEVTSPFQSPATEGKMSSMPKAGMSDGSSRPQQQSISDIIRVEQEELAALEHFKAKPLDIISKEDRAIEELLAHYRADGNPNERVTVVRVLPYKVAAPTWTKK